MSSSLTTLKVQPQGTFVHNLQVRQGEPFALVPRPYPEYPLSGFFPQVTATFCGPCAPVGVPPRDSSNSFEKAPTVILKGPKMNFRSHPHLEPGDPRLETSNDPSPDCRSRSRLLLTKPSLRGEEPGRNRPARMKCLSDSNPTVLDGQAQ